VFCFLSCWGCVSGTKQRVPSIDGDRDFWGANKRLVLYTACCFVGKLLIWNNQIEKKKLKSVLCVKYHILLKIYNLITFLYHILNIDLSVIKWNRVSEPLSFSLSSIASLSPCVCVCVCSGVRGLGSVWKHYERPNQSLRQLCTTQLQLSFYSKIY